MSLEPPAGRPTPITMGPRHRAGILPASGSVTNARKRLRRLRATPLSCAADHSLGPVVGLDWRAGILNGAAAAQVRRKGTECRDAEEVSAMAHGSELRSEHGGEVLRNLQAVLLLPW